MYIKLLTDFNGGKNGGDTYDPRSCPLHETFKINGVLDGSAQQNTAPPDRAESPHPGNPTSQMAGEKLGGE